MKNIFFVLIVIAFFSGCKKDHSELVSKSKIEPHIFEVIDRKVKVEISQLKVLDTNYQEMYYEGITFKLLQDDAYNFVFENQEHFNSLGYFLFLGDIDIKITKDDSYLSYFFVNVVKETNMYTIVEIMKSSGLNYDIDNDQVISKLQKWDSKYGIRLYGAEFDYVFIGFKTIPDNLTKFGKEAYEFCPDAVDQNYGTLEEMIRDISENNMLFLWWD